MAKAPDAVGVEEFGRLIGVTRQAVHQYIQQGMPHRQRSGATKIVPPEAIKWLRERDRANARKEESPVIALEQARKMRAEADLKELELAERRRELVPFAEAQERYDEFVGGFAAVASGRLQRFEREIIRATTPADARRLTQAIHVALMQGALEYADQREAEADELDAAAFEESDDDGAASA